MPLLVGVDVGTTSTKAVLYDPERGEVLAVAARPTVAHHPRPDWSEFDPEELWQGVAGAVRAATSAAKGAVAAIAVASMGEAGVPLDARGRCLYPIVAWHDPRTEPLAAWWRERCDPARLFAITGQTPRHIYGLNKLLWLRAERPAVFRALRHWLSVEDFVLWKLCGQFATDHSVASRTMAFDQRTLGWSDELLAIAGVPAQVWPTPLPSGTALAPLTSFAAEATGLTQSTLAVTGGHDHLCGALAAGLLAPGPVLDSTGTAQALLTLSGEYRPTDRLRQAGLSFYRYVVRDRYVLQAGLSAAGGSVAWLAETLGASVETVLAEAAAVPPGSHGLLWLPHLLGSGSPENDPDSRGALLGLTTAHARGELARALLEALCYWLRQNVALLEGELGGLVSEIIAIGGATRSPLWLALKADVTGLPVRVPALGEAAATGAALLAGVGAGIFADEAAAVGSLRAPSTQQAPDPRRAMLYGRLYHELYQPLYAVLREVNHRLARLGTEDLQS